MLEGQDFIRSLQLMLPHLQTLHSPPPSLLPSSQPLLFSNFLLAEAADGMENRHTFLYFAYGSNLLKERLQLKNPSAMVHCVARLMVQSNIRRVSEPSHKPYTLTAFFSLFQDYRLVFGNYKGLASDRWHGGVATIEHSPGDEVWGVVWRMSMSDLESLDR